MARLLLIHPDQKLVGIYERHLAPYFNVDSAHDGLAGLRLIKQNQPSIIVSDYELPFMSGLALLKFVRNHPQMYATPFMFLSNELMMDEALGLGANAWLNQKDHGPEQLKHKILEMVANHRS